MISVGAFYQDIDLFPLIKSNEDIAEYYAGISNNSRFRCRFLFRCKRRAGIDPDRLGKTRASVYPPQEAGDQSPVTHWNCLLNDKIMWKILNYFAKSPITGIEMSTPLYAL
ncbi:MAG: hypothetical protein ACYCSG_05200 [Thermoplasmataceae archaeon]